MSDPVVFRSLTVSTGDGAALVGPLDLELRPGGVHAIVGESGSGKTLTLRAIAGIVPENLVAQFGDGDTTSEPQTALVFQDPASYFNPRWRVRRSIREVLRYGRRRSVTTIEALAEVVGLPVREFDKYPFELSGGMIQRAAIAMALATDPDLLLADEITSALDPQRAERILLVIRDIARARGLAVLIVSHDLPLVARVADDVRVLYRGLVVEHGPAATVLRAPRHRYTDYLVRALPSREHRGRNLAEIPPDETPIPVGACPFLPRCPAAGTACREMPGWDAAHRVRCHHPVDGGDASDG